MAIADASGFLYASYVGSVSPNEVNLDEQSIDRGFTMHVPYKLIGYKAYDSDRID